MVPTKSDEKSMPNSTIFESELNISSSGVTAASVSMSTSSSSVAATAVSMLSLSSPGYVGECFEIPETELSKKVALLTPLMEIFDGLTRVYEELAKLSFMGLTKSDLKDLQETLDWYKNTLPGLPNKPIQDAALSFNIVYTSLINLGQQLKKKPELKLHTDEYDAWVKKLSPYLMNFKYTPEDMQDIEIIHVVTDYQNAYLKFLCEQASLAAELLMVANDEVSESSTELSGSEMNVQSEKKVNKKLVGSSEAIPSHESESSITIKQIQEFKLLCQEFGYQQSGNLNLQFQQMKQFVLKCFDHKNEKITDEALNKALDLIDALEEKIKSKKLVIKPEDWLQIRLDILPPPRVESSPSFYTGSIASPGFWKDSIESNKRKGEALKDEEKRKVIVTNGTFVENEKKSQMGFQK